MGRINEEGVFHDEFSDTENYTYTYICTFYRINFSIFPVIEFQ